MSGHLYGLSTRTLTSLRYKGMHLTCGNVWQNPADFVAPFDSFEFANFAKTEEADLLICSMNWLDSETEAVGTFDTRDSWSTVQDTLGYWATRLSPLIGSEAVFVACNRVGTERGTKFTGSSCVMRMSETPSVLGFLGKSEEQVLVVEVETDR